MARRRPVYRDELWRLALARDLAGLRRAASLVEDGYDAHRARAFSLAVAGRVDAAVQELSAGWGGDWPFPAGYALDVARVRFLGGELDGALSSLAAAARDGGPPDPAVAALARECVRSEPSLLWRALALALRRGPVRRRLRDAASLVRARMSSRKRRHSESAG